ncbi:MAG: ATP-binding protein [Ruminococcus sp.]|nr:ATP-binding protein [Ruminococcus sp.]MBR1752883.1 ATP-binding protein [Ruminococcus sp.]
MQTLQQVLDQNETLTARGIDQQNFKKDDYFNREYYERRARAFNSARVPSTDGIECDICGNKELIQYVLEEDGRFYEQCELCACVERRNAKRKIAKSGLEKNIDETGEYEVHNEWQKVIKAKADKFVTQNKDRCFYIGGQSGAGKTHISTLISKKLMEEGKPLLYCKWTELMDKLNNWNNELRDSLYDDVTTIKVLYLDDFFKPIGSNPYTRAEIRTTFEIIDRRYVNSDLITIISSELTSDRINAIDTALARRIIEMAGEYITDISNDTSKIFRRVDWRR